MSSDNAYAEIERSVTCVHMQKFSIDSPLMLFQTCITLFLYSESEWWRLYDCRKKVSHAGLKQHEGNDDNNFMFDNLLSF